jgi:hypothetical protein
VLQQRHRAQQQARRRVVRDILVAHTHVHVAVAVDGQTQLVAPRYVGDKAIERIDVDVSQMPHTYFAKYDYRREIDEMKEMLGKIFDKLDTKQDK